MTRTPVTNPFALKAIKPYSQAVWTGSPLFYSERTPIDPEIGKCVPSGIGEKR